MNMHDQHNKIRFRFDAPATVGHATLPGFSFSIKDRSVSRTSAANTRRRKTRLKEARHKGTHTSKEWQEMKSFFGNICVRCEIPPNAYGIIKDHIVPIYLGGSDSIRNLQPLCNTCNCGKGPDSIDYRALYCEKHHLEMPSKWLGNNNE